MGGLGALIFIISAMVIVLVIQHTFDDLRIRSEMKKRGSRLLTKDWKPFIEGWFGQGQDRLYLITYIDERGHVHEAVVRTRMFMDVIFSQHKIITEHHGLPR